MMKYIAVALLVLAASLTAEAQSIGGATSAASLAANLISAVNKQYKCGIPAYSSVGSGAGIDGYIGGKYLVALSDVPLTAAEALKRATGTFPLTIATYSVINKAGGLSLSGCQLANIYLGKITKFEQIAGSKRKGTIVPLMRSPASGTTEVFTKYLRAACPGSWPQRFVGQGPYKTGNPKLTFVSSSSAMTKAVSDNGLAIGYAQTNYALIVAKNKEVAIENAAGKRVTAGTTDPYNSLPRPIPASFASWSGVSLVFKSGPKTFPIVSFVYALARASYAGAGSKCACVKNFLTYANSAKGQALSGANYFTSLPSGVISSNKAGIAKIKC